MYDDLMFDYSYYSAASNSAEERRRISVIIINYKLEQDIRSRVKKTIIIVQLAIYGSPYLIHHESLTSISDLLLRGFISISCFTLKCHCRDIQMILF